MSTISTQQRKLLRVGMSSDELHALLGPPSEVLNPRETVTPSEVFAALGSQFRFGDEDIDTVWTYSDETRPKLLFCLGMRSGHLAAVWRVTRKDR